jgi:hypothetical protein
LLPNERANRALVRARSKMLLSQATDLHRVAVAVLQQSLGGAEQSGLRIPNSHIDSTVVFVALGLYVKACKQHRSVQLLARAGLSPDALAIARNLFETTLALVFILRKQIRLRRGFSPAHPSGLSLSAIQRRPLSTRFRARLYQANLVFEQERTRDEFARTPRIKREARRITKRLPQLIAEAEKAIGPEWTRRLRQARSYSGVSLKELALSMGFRGAYATHYRFASWTVHALDLNRYIAFDPSKNASMISLAPNADYVDQALSIGNVLLFQCIHLFDDRFELKHKRALQSRWGAIARTAPPRAHR